MERIPVINMFTIDVEDYFQVSAFENDVPRESWELMESRVQYNTNRILDLLNRHDIKATFFVLGWVAERHKELVARIDSFGHEVACHGFSHKLIYNQTMDEFREETQKAKSILEDIVQKPVIGYRAASYSITKKSLWALDILADSGFKYDSSIYPVRHDRYGIPDCQERPFVFTSKNNRKILECPLSVYKVLNYKLPISGGGYFRLYPYKFTKYALKKANNAGEPFVFYLHPWEIDVEQPRISTNILSSFRHYNNLSKCESRLQKLLMDFKFSRMDKVLEKNNYFS